MSQRESGGIFRKQFEATRHFYIRYGPLKLLHNLTLKLKFSNLLDEKRAKHSRTPPPRPIPRKSFFGDVFSYTARVVSTYKSSQLTFVTFVKWVPGFHFSVQEQQLSNIVSVQQSLSNIQRAALENVSVPSVRTRFSANPSGTNHEVRGILILMKVGISTSTWFQVVPFCSLISEQFLFSLSDDFLRRL